MARAKFEKTEYEQLGERVIEAVRSSLAVQDCLLDELEAARTELAKRGEDRGVLEEALERTEEKLAEVGDLPATVGKLEAQLKEAAEIHARTLGEKISAQEVAAKLVPAIKETLADLERWAACPASYAPHALVDVGLDAIKATANRLQLALGALGAS